MAASTLAGGLEGCGPSQPLPAVNRPHFTAPTERTPSSSRGSASHGLDCFRAESCSPLGERMAVPHHFIPLLLGCLSASLKVVRDGTNKQRRRQPLSKPTLWAVPSWLIFCPAAAGPLPDETPGLGGAGRRRRNRPQPRVESGQLPDETLGLGTNRRSALKSGR